MIHFMKATLSMPLLVRLWLGILMMVNMALPLFFISTSEGMATLATAMAGALTMSIIFKKYGFIRLLGIGHIYWLPLVLWLLSRLEQVESGIFFHNWILAVITLNSISLLIDLSDVIRYLKGERAPYIEPMP